MSIHRRVTLTDYLQRTQVGEVTVTVLGQRSGIEETGRLGGLGKGSEGEGPE